MAEISLQWKNTDACYDFYCDCNPDEPQHFDGYFKQEMICGSRIDPADEEAKKLTYCGKTWHLPNQISAIAGPFNPEA